MDFTQKTAHTIKTSDTDIPEAGGGFQPEDGTLREPATSLELEVDFSQKTTHTMNTSDIISDAGGGFHSEDGTHY